MSRAAPWLAVVPVKPAAAAKTRLVGVDEPQRMALARAFALDTVAAVAAALSVGTVVVVTSGNEWPQPWPGDADVLVVTDDLAGMNDAVRRGMSWVRQHRSEAAVAVFPADLPAATPAAVECFLRRAAAHERSVLADIEMVGSTALTASPGAALRPAFGPASLHHHLTGGAVLVELSGLEPLRRDVDLAAHLRAAVRLGVGPRTTEVLAEAASPSRP